MRILLVTPFLPHSGAPHGGGIILDTMSRGLTARAEVGLVAIAGLLGVITQMQIGARESARSTRIAQDKIDELMKLNFSSDPAVAIGGDLASDVTDYSETPLAGITLRWAVSAGPTADLRVLTLRVVNLRTLQYRETDLTTIIRKW